MRKINLIYFIIIKKINWYNLTMNLIRIAILFIISMLTLLTINCSKYSHESAKYSEKSDLYDSSENDELDYGYSFQGSGSSGGCPYH